MKIAMLGGSFNPVHNGHIALAKLAIDNFDYDEVHFVPAFNPPHKNLASGATDEDRCTMVSLVIADYPAFKIETCELERKGTSYTIDTVTYLQNKYKGKLQGKIGLIIGEDLVRGFHQWKNVTELVETTDVLLAFREGDSTVNDFNFSFTYSMMNNIPINVSSHEIRNRIVQKGDWKSLVPKNVFEYINNKKLYENS